MKELLFELVGPAVSSTLETMAGMQASLKEHHQEHEAKNHGIVTSILNITSNQGNSTAIVHFKKEVALKIAENIFGMSETELTNDVLDACGEITNIISGNIANNMREKTNEDFKLGTPTVITGSDYKTNLPKNTTSEVFNFELDDANKEQLTIEIRVENTENR